MVTSSLFYLVTTSIHKFLKDKVHIGVSITMFKYYEEST